MEDEPSSDEEEDEDNEQYLKTLNPEEWKVLRGFVLLTVCITLTVYLLVVFECLYCLIASFCV